jgi:hypothetical protein
MTTPKPPNPYDISALLREAGFVAAGRYRNDEGYRATWGERFPDERSVCVQFYPAGDGTSGELLASAALVLTAYGYAVETDTRTPCLIVTAREGDWPR